jgi:hypothetical protein
MRSSCSMRQAFSSLTSAPSRLSLFGLQQRDALGGNGFFIADGADALAGLCLQTDALDFDVEDVGQPLADDLAMGEKLGTLCEDDAVDVDDSPAERRHGVNGSGEHFGGIASSVFGIGIGIHLADIAQRGRAEERVDHGMKQGIAVAMPDRLPIVRNIDAAEPQRPSWLKPMQIVPNPDPYVVRGSISLC